VKIAVIGAGAIGGLVAGYLKLKGQEVSLVGHPDSVSAIKKSGLSISGVRGKFNLQIEIFPQLNYYPELVILCTKTQGLETVFRGNREFFKGSKILTSQNGIQADEIVSRYVPKEDIISSIVMFGATHLEPAKVVHNFEGGWIIGKIFSPNDAGVNELAGLLNQIFPTSVSENLRGMKILKIFVNANNCLPAILGTSMQEAFSDPQISRISMAIWKEGLKVVNASGIMLLSLPDFPLERLTKLTSLPLEEAGKIFSGIMQNLSKEPLYGSILQSIKRGRLSEIDYINGEFVNLAKNHNSSAPLNEKLVELVHQVEKSKKFFTPGELLEQTEGLIHG